MIGKLMRFWQIAKDTGLRTAMILFLRHLFIAKMNSAETSRKIQEVMKWNIDSEKIAQHLAYRDQHLAGKIRPETIHWILPRLSAGSGGHRTATRMIRHLVECGYKLTVWIYDPRPSEVPRIAADLEKFYDLKGVEAYPLTEPDSIAADILVATDAWTAIAAASVVRVIKKFYFVQDFESLFHEAGSLSVLLNYTYTLGFYPITAGPWLKELLKSTFNVEADAFELACDHDIYNTEQRKEPDHPTVVFYARGNTPRRCVELGFAALETLKRRMPQVNVILFGVEKAHERIPFNAEVHGIISPREIAKLYARSTVGLSLSATNHSLIPNEMMACGLPVVELNSANNTRIYPKGTVTFADGHPALIAEKIEHLLRDEKARKAITSKSLHYAKQLTWENSAKKVESSILRNFRKAEKVRRK